MAVSAYRSPHWLPGGHAQTLYPYLFFRPPLAILRRERVDTPDGDFVDLDWIDGPPGSPVVVLFHGLEGSSRSHYSLGLLRAAARRGWRAVVPHWRGCSGEPNRLPRAYHSGDHAEVGWMLRAIRARIGEGTEAFAIGVSLGGSALLNWLGREAAPTLAAAASISAPIDLVTSGYAIDRGWNRIYASNFLRTLLPKAFEKARRFPGLLDREAMKRVRHLMDFDDCVTAPLHGFRNAVDYWTRSSSLPYLRKIGTPTLVLNARNDPFIPGDSLPGPGDVSAAVTLDLPPHGGHVGFTDALFPGGLKWMADRVLGFFDRFRNGGGAPRL